MANYIESTDIRPETFVTFTSRYSDSPVLYYSEKKKITFATYKRKAATMSAGDRDKFMVITKGAEYRPDLVSYDVYGVPDFWWRIMEVNGMKDIMEFKVGTNIRLPMNITV